MTLARLIGVGLRLAVFAAAVVALRAQLATSPVANEAVRSLGPEGDWRTASPPALYNAGDYYTELGFAHISAAANRQIAEGSEAPRFPELAEAEALLREALARSPADAVAWAALALSAVVDNDTDTAEVALRRSWALAPYNAGLSTMRLAALAFVDPASVDPALLDSVRRDFRVARREAGAQLARMIGAAPALARLRARAGADRPPPG